MQPGPAVPINGTDTLDYKIALFLYREPEPYFDKKSQLLTLVYTVLVTTLAISVFKIASRKLVILTDPELNRSANILSVRSYRYIKVIMILIIVLNWVNISSSILVTFIAKKEAENQGIPVDQITMPLDTMPDGDDFFGQGTVNSVKAAASLIMTALSIARGLLSQLVEVNVIFEWIILCVIIRREKDRAINELLY